MSLLEVSVEAGDLGPVIVLAGDADDSSVTQLNEALTALVSARTTHLTIDATNLRSIDPATAQALMLAALLVMVQGGSTVLVNPQEPVLMTLNHTRTTEMFTIQARPPAETAPDTSVAGEPEKGDPPMTALEHEPDWSVTLRRQPASLSTGHAEGDTSTFDIICRECGDDPGLDYREVSPELRQIRGPYLLKAGIAAFLKHGEYHDRAEETGTHHARPDLAIPDHAPLSHTAALGTATMRAMADLGRHRHTRQAAPFGREQDHASSLHPEGQAFDRSQAGRVAGFWPLHDRETGRNVANR